MSNDKGHNNNNNNQFVLNIGFTQFLLRVGLITYDLKFNQNVNLNLLHVYLKVLILYANSYQNHF